MRPGSANIRSPEALARLRHRYLEFDKQVRGALELVTGDIHSVSEWLHREQLPYWKREHARRHDAMKEAWREYINARYGDRRMGKPSCVDERKAYERAKRRKEEAEARIATVERWLIALEQRTGKLLPPVKRLEALMEMLSPKAVARLDHMLDRLEDYLRPSSASSAGPSRSPEGREGGDAPSQPA